MGPGRLIVSQEVMRIGGRTDTEVYELREFSNELVV